MKVLLVYFTGTYNTLYITTLIKNRLLNKGYQVDVLPFIKYKNQSVEQYDLIGIGYPIHAFNSPKIVVETLSKMNITNKKYFIYKVSGEPYKLNNASSYKIYKLLKKSNNTLIGEYHYLMPYNILFRTKEDFIVHELKYDIKLIKYMVDHLNEIKPYKVSLLYRFISKVFLIQQYGCKKNIKKYTVDKAKCIKCRKCMEMCPTNNIFYNKETHRIEFKDNCLMCMRCSFYCPTNCIDIGLLNKYKVNGAYDLNNLVSQEDTYDINKENAKFYKRFKKYFNNIDKLVSER